MWILVPNRDFLRVEDKFFAAFVLEDPDLSPGATLLYLKMYRLAGHHGTCAPSQSLMARLCKSSERTVQTYLRQLANLGYIRIQRDGAHNVYQLIYSSRIGELVHKAGIVMTGEKYSPIDQGHTQNPARDGENFSSSLRNKRRDQDPPLSPPAKKRPSRQTSQGGGFSSPASGKRVRSRGSALPLPASAPAAPDLACCGNEASSISWDDGRGNQDNFERLFAVWPLHQDKLFASQVFRRLSRSGILPPLDELLAVVARFKAEDRKWRNGYVPSLAYWLKGHRWLDEPTPPTQVIPCAASARGLASSSPNYCVPSAPPIDPDLVSRARALQEKYASDARNKGELSSTADTICALWPEEPRGKILASLAVAGLRGCSLKGLAARARQFLENGALTIPVSQWLRESTA